MTAAALPLYALPAIGAPWPGQGGTFAGLVRDSSSGLTRALILADAKPDKRLPWRKAMDWAQAVRADGHADFTLPSRNEGPVLFGNLRDQFEPRWHWLSEEFDRSCAWYQHFLNGTQYGNHEGNELSARAVRSFVLQSFDPSTGASA
jgi:hypothetical protein